MKTTIEQKTIVKGAICAHTKQQIVEQMDAAASKLVEKMPSEKLRDITVGVIVAAMLQDHGLTDDFDPVAFLETAGVWVGARGRQRFARMEAEDCAAARHETRKDGKQHKKNGKRRK